MRRNLAKGRIAPKISTMPRQQTEAAAFLDIYKLVIEKKRLQQELDGMDQRRQQILNRLAVLNQQVSDLEKTAHDLRQDSTLPESGTLPGTLSGTLSGTSSRPIAKSLPPAAQTSTGETIDTLFLDY